MIRNFLVSFIVLVAFCTNATAQTAYNASHTLVWKTSNGNNSSFINSTQGDIVGLPQFCSLIKVNDNAEYEAVISNMVLENITKGELNGFDKLELGPKPKVKLGYGSYKGGHQVSYCLYPYVLQNGQIKRLKSFDIALKQMNTVSKRNKVQQNFKTSSVLSSGDWYKFSIDNSGIFKITPSYLEELGISTSGVAISDVRIFGNGDGMVAALNSASRKDDLREVPLKAVDANNNGFFDGSDYVLFYANGPHTWEYKDGKFNHILNIFRDKNYYFLTLNSGVGKRIVEAASVSDAVTNVVSSFDDYAFDDADLENVVGVGRVWLGNLFESSEPYASAFSFPNIDVSSPIRVKATLAARVSSNNTSMQVNVSGQNLMDIPLSAYSTATGAAYLTSANDEKNINISTSNFTISMVYNNSANPTGVAWLDYLEIQARRQLTYTGKAMSFRDVNSIGVGNVSEFRLLGTSNSVEIWDVTDINEAKKIQTQTITGGLSFKVNTDTLREFVAVSGSTFSNPEYVGKVENQNLHGMATAKMFIITHPNFVVAAERLASFHRENRGLSIEVITVNQIYNEFSSGGQDITAIRDFSRMMYERGDAGENTFKYILLFGDASYDYKGILTDKSNYVPTWESKESYNTEASTVTDDYFGMLDPNEGEDGNMRFSLIDIGVGRIPCGSLGQAQLSVDKVINYVSGKNRYGDWRNKILLMADDVDESWEPTFVNVSEQIESRIKKSSNAFSVQKIYLDAYQQKTSSGTQTYPEANKDMFRSIQSGNLVTNYIGHGGEIGFSSERFLGLTDINAWTNYDAMPLFVTITCEFTRVDDPKRVSAGEQLLLNPNGGAIALISTTRTVEAGRASNLNRYVFDSLLTRNNGVPKELGEIIRDAKNGSELNGDYNKLKFSLFGDPSIQLAIPHNKVQTNTINNINVNSGVVDTLKALSLVTLTGQVNDLSEQKISDFNGVLNISIYDKPRNRETLNNDNTLGTDGQPLPPISFKLQNNLIYKGKVAVQNGDFSVEFLVPKDIAYNVDYGKISYYAENGSIDAAGVYDTVYVGGYNDNAGEDNVGPLVELYINDESFVQGGITDQNPELYAIVSDSSGINTVGNGIGHDLSAQLDGNTEQTYIINEYYEADLNSYQSGKVRYPFYDLETGAHTLKLKVFDAHNNFSDAETDFVVADDAEMALEHVLNYPNPFTTYTEFHFEHNRANQPLDVQVQIFTISGKLVKTINTSIVPAGNRVTGISWDGLDDYGDKIGKGVYVYRLKVRSALENSQAEKYEKLVILR